MSSDRRFALLIAWTVAAGTLLGDGIAYGWPWAIVIGAAMSGVCPWGIVIASLVRWARSRLPGHEQVGPVRLRL